MHLSTCNALKSCIHDAQRPQRIFCSYSEWIHKLYIFQSLKCDTYEQYLTQWNSNTRDQCILRRKLYSWINKFNLMSDKMVTANIPQLSVRTAPYLSLQQMIDYTKLQTFLYGMDDLCFDNFDICNDIKQQIVENMINGVYNGRSINNKFMNLIKMYDELLSLPTVCNQTTVVNQINKQLYFSLKEAEINTNRHSIVHYNEYLKDRGYGSATILCASYLSHIIDGAMNINDFDQTLICLSSDITILFNDLLGFDREYQNGEICSYPLLLKYHDGISAMDAQQQTYELIVSKMMQFKVVSKEICNTNEFENKLHFVLRSWIVGYYLHERNCSRQKLSYNV